VSSNPNCATTAFEIIKVYDPKSKKFLIESEINNLVEIDANGYLNLLDFETQRTGVQIYVLSKN
jgi:hypothetical protein